jgi:hypothetical protein
MTKDDVIRMARQAGMERVVKLHSDGTRTVELPHPDLLESSISLKSSQLFYVILSILCVNHNAFQNLPKNNWI